MNIISDVTEDFNTGHDLDKLEMFYVDHADEFGMAADEAMLTAIKETKANLHWMKNHHPELVLMIQKKNMAAPQQWSSSVNVQGGFMIHVKDDTLTSCNHGAVLLLYWSFMKMFGSRVQIPLTLQKLFNDFMLTSF